MKVNKYKGDEFKRQIEGVMLELSPSAPQLWNNF